jgi:ABC-type uncharacterized transport system permease subunit
MTISPNVTLYIAISLYALGTLAALASLFRRSELLQRAGLVAMIAGWIAHTIWIGTICTITGHPPLTNLPEASSFVAWTVFAVELGLLIRYRVHAASFFVHPLMLILLTITAVVHEPFAKVTPAMRSRIFTAHVLFTTLGIAALFVGIAFTLLAIAQDRSLKAKTRGRLWQWIPSLSICKLLSYRALAIGFTIYTFGIIAGVMWSYQSEAGLMELRIKQIGAVVAWVLFAVLLQSAITGAFRARRTVFVSAGAFVATLIAILGIHHG